MTVLVQRLQRLELAFAPWSWPFAEDHRAEIERFFRRECEKNPALWNGRLLLLRDANVADAVMSGSFFESDYASLLAGLGLGTMGETVKACFPAAAVLTSDDAFLLGEMAPHTHHAGELLFPCGSVERADAAGGRVDLFATLRRELWEETGLSADTLEADDDWYAVSVGPRLPVIKIMRSGERADELKARISQNLLAQQSPELRDIVVVRDPSQLDDRMPAWVSAFLRYAWAAENAVIRQKQRQAAP
jgi:8-oxo-dGTP pyrophosphatase MutT (NUDIX family)